MSIVHGNFSTEKNKDERIELIDEDESCARFEEKLSCN
jgi:hypothetical protein